jgi:molybdate transport system ATP-binding protein
MSVRGLEVRLNRQFDGFKLDLDVSLPSHGVTILFGASGSGKTTVLRGIAGLDRVTKGRVVLNGEIWQDTDQGYYLKPSDRPVGYVFQDAALFPHLTVEANLNFGLRRSGAPGLNARPLIDLLDLGSLLTRYPEQLSGGEQQRVAIARALLSSPHLLLMDEPLASMDLARRDEFIPYLERLHQTLKIPVLYVTHAPEEVLRLADSMILMDAGEVLVSGELSEVLPALSSRPGFEDAFGIVIHGTLLAHHPEDGVSEIEFADGRLWLPLVPLREGSKVRCRIHPSDVSLSLLEPSSTSALNILPATIEEVSPLGDGGRCQVELRLGRTPILSTVTRKSQKELGLKPGLPVYVQIKATRLIR